MEPVLSEASSWISQHFWALERLTAAGLIGMAVGLERELRDKPAGLRTMILISVGSCLYAMISQRLGGLNADPTRIAAQIVTGVGFLGAGAILRGLREVHGLTTAATIWMLAAVGMTCGFGELALAALAGLGTLVVLLMFQPLVRTIDERRTIMNYRIATTSDHIGFDHLEPTFREARLKILSRNCYHDRGEKIFLLRAVGHRARHLALREKLMRDQTLVLRRS
jgi:putative Mg2+ transporter-C (MgtC) family protein